MTMAGALTPTLTSKELHNWLKGAISILYAKEGLTEFVQNEIEQSKENFLQYSIKQNGLPPGTKCSACTTANVLSCPTHEFCGKLEKCNIHDTNIPEKTPDRPCPNRICNALMKNIRDQHRYAGPSWKNTDASRWCTDAFEIEKCFQPPNSSHIQSLTETDFNGVISIIINNKRFQNKFRADLNTEPNICTKARDAASAIWHSADHLLPDKDLAVYIDDMIALFCDQAYLAKDPKAQNVVTNLKLLKLNTMIDTDDVVALKESLRASFAQFDNQEKERLETVKDQHFMDHMDQFAAELSKFKSKILKDIQKQAGDEKKETNSSELPELSKTDHKANKLMFDFEHKDPITDVSMQQLDEMLPNQDTVLMVTMTLEEYEKWIRTEDSVKLNENHVGSSPRIIGIETRAFKVSKNTIREYKKQIELLRSFTRFHHTPSKHLDYCHRCATKEARDAASAIWHSADHLLPDKDLAVYIDDMIALFCDQAYLAKDPKAQNVVTNLKLLKLNTMIDTDDVVALKESLRASFAQFDNQEKERLETVKDQHFMDHMDQFAAELSKFKSKILKDIQKQAGDEKKETNSSELPELSKTDHKANKLMFDFEHKDPITDVSMQQLDEMLPNQDTVLMVTMTLEEYEKWIRTEDSVKLNENHVGSSPRIIGIEPCYWECYLQSLKYIPARQITDSTPLPDQNYLNRLQKKYLDTKSVHISDLLKNIERRVCNTVKVTNEDVQYVWLAYTQTNDHDVEVKVIIETNDHGKTFILEGISYETCVVHYNSFSEEAKVVMAHCEDVDELSFSNSIMVRHCIHRHSDTWLASHKHLSIIDASSVRSKGFNSNSSSSKHEIILDKCIVFYVRKKGFIPIGEEPFERKYDEFPVDVREGVFYAHMQASTESQDTLKMGLTIYKKMPTNEYIRGTLGGFIDHPQYGLCGITCAHVLLDDIEMARLQDKGELSWLDFTPESASVYIKDKNAASNMESYIRIGRLVKAVLTKGEDGGHGMDTAIFQIEKFFPENGLFVNECAQAEDPLRFDSGKAYGPSRLCNGMKVFKYGSTTGKTSGVLLKQLPVITVRTLADQFPAHLVMHNQLEIKGIDTVFADKGDSGASVLIDNTELFCLGIVEGITSYDVTIVTPIGPVLEKLNVPSLKCFDADKLRNSVNRLQSSLQRTIHHIQQTKTEADKIRGSVNRLENTTRRLEERLEQTKRSIEETKNETDQIRETVNRLENDLKSKTTEILLAVENQRYNFCTVV